MPSILQRNLIIKQLLKKQIDVIDAKTEIILNEKGGLNANIVGQSAFREDNF